MKYLLTVALFIFIFGLQADVRAQAGPGGLGPQGRGYCQVDEKLVDQPPRCWARARREPAMLGIRNGRSLNLTIPTCSPRRGEKASCL